MIEDVAFQTRARTIDHLGREQIADCPTAVSELWKNSYDAYARNVSLDIFEGEMPIAMLSDDGHGMNKDEIKNKWLVVGTDSKSTNTNVPEKDRNGLPYRVKQGQKGIGRLSCGHLGSLLLLISKRKNDDFVVAIIDWRIFENPYLLLQDIRIPVASFKETKDIFPELPIMLDKLMGNIWGDKNNKDKEVKERNLRIKSAWESFEILESENKEDLFFKSTKEKIESTIISASFPNKILEHWELSKNKTGTALLISNIEYGLSSLINSGQDSISIGSKSKTFETLSNFTDPYVKDEENIEFNYSVNVWKDNTKAVVVGKSNQFSLNHIKHLEHVIDGAVDEDGLFKGKIKAFGEWFDGEVNIPMHEDLKVPKTKNLTVGHFDFFVATTEFDPQFSSHSKEELIKIKELAGLYSGFMIFRDSLRVMPYGREDNDFFEIEKRRSMHAGREFWNHRQMFGRISISQHDNPNLRDKAGREGIVDNRSAKIFKDIVENILKVSARRYFGTNSEKRLPITKYRKEEYKKLKAKEENKKANQKLRKNFRNNLKKYDQDLTKLIVDLDNVKIQIYSNATVDIQELNNFSETVVSLKQKHRELVLGNKPAKLGSLEESYLNFRDKYNNFRQTSLELLEVLTEKIEAQDPRNIEEIAEDTLKSYSSLLKRRITSWKKKALDLLEKENRRITDLASSRYEIFEINMRPLIHDVKKERISLRKFKSFLDDELERLNTENEEVFDPYIGALDFLQENIDIFGIASFGNEELTELKDEVNRLNALAQLGITVEILGHEMSSYEHSIRSGLEKLPKDLSGTSAYKLIKTGFEQLIEKLNFLSPLKLSGNSNQEWIKGEEIYEVLNHFFFKQLKRSSITFEANSQFLEFKVYDYKHRILPVFINLINNAIYWVKQSEEEPKIQLTFTDNKVIISDNGPGVEEEDIKELFNLFFTRKIRGGRGVGLYLCRTNLAASGYSISYIVEDEMKVLSGANFVIDLKGY